MCREPASSCWILSFPLQVWESVPYLTSYVSPALREGRSIPLLPRELEAAWNGESMRWAHQGHIQPGPRGVGQSC